MAYTLNQELLINGLVKEKIQDLQHLIHDKKGLLSVQQGEKARQDLKNYQKIQYQNRLNRQIKF